MTELVERIWDQCDKEGLLFDNQHLPIKVGPDCYIVYATPKTDGCVKEGKCQQQRYYALTGGKEVELIL